MPVAKLPYKYPLYIDQQFKNVQLKSHVQKTNLTDSEVETCIQVSFINVENILFFFSDGKCHIYNSLWLRVCTKKCLHKNVNEFFLQEMTTPQLYYGYININIKYT